MPRHNSKRKANEFLDIEAEASGSEADHADDNENSDSEENSQDRAFIDNNALIEYHPSAPPPLFLSDYYDRMEPYIEEVLDDVPPPPPPPPGTSSLKPPQAAFTKAKLTSFYKPSGKPAAKPPAGVMPPPPAPPPEPPKDPPVKIRVPKARAPKKLTALIQSHLVPSALVGSLTYTLVTLIPNIECTIEDSWKGIQAAYATVTEQLRLLIGLFGAFTCIETHGETHKPLESQAGKKKKTAKPGDPTAAPDQVELDFFETNDGTLEGADPVQYIRPNRANKLTGKAHMHILCWYSDYHFPRIDYSVLKRYLLDLFPNGDVHEVHMRESIKNKTPHYVRATAYIFKSIECPSTLDNWHKYIDKDGTPPLPEFHHGAPFMPDAPLTESIKRWLLFLEKITRWCRYTVNTAAGAAAGLFHEEHRMGEEEKAMRTFAEILRLLGVIVFAGAEPGSQRFYELERRTDYQVLRSVGKAHDIHWLHRRLQAIPAGIGYFITYREKIPHWVKMDTVFSSIPKPTYDWVELKDGYYNVHTNLYRYKNDPGFEFVRQCFRSYAYTVKELQTTQPTRWINLLNYVCEPVSIASLPDPKNPYGPPRSITKQVDKARLLLDFALLLRRRKPKQPVPFLYGVSNSGKTTLSSFIRCLYPVEAIAAINNSSAPFSSIHEETQLVYNEEFKVETCSREELLVLLDGAQHLTVRKLHQDARLIENPLMPILLQDNYYPTYYHDDSQALENRLSLHYFPRSIEKVDLDEYPRIADEHLLVVRYLNEHLIAHEKTAALAAKTAAKL
jgi:hypothetical protein